MKRIVLSLLSVATIATAMPPKGPIAKPCFDAIAEFFINYSTIFADAKKEGASQEKLDYLKQQQRLAKIGVAIDHTDIKTLQETPTELLASHAQVFVEESASAPNGEGRYCFGADNALGFVLLHSVDNKTAKDHANTIAMLKVMFAKKLNPYAQIGYAFFDKEGRDYVPSRYPNMIEFAEGIARRNPCAQTEEIYQLIRAYAEQPEIAKFKGIVPVERTN